MRWIFFSLFVFFTLSVSAQAVKYTGELFKQNSNRNEKLFTLNVDITAPVEGKSEVHTIYKDLAGKTVVEENSVIEGTKLVKYSVDHIQSEQKATVEVTDGKVLFSHTNKGVTKKAEEKLGDSLVISANFNRFVFENWGKINKSETVKFRYAAWQRRETVGFEIFKIGEEKNGEESVVVVKMKPSNFIISALVKPLVFKYSADGSKLVGLNGRVPPMEKSGDGFKDLDAEVVYSY